MCRQRCDQRKYAQGVLCMGMSSSRWDYSSEWDTTWSEDGLHVRHWRADVCWLCHPFDLLLVVLGNFPMRNNQAWVDTTQSQFLGHWACLNWTFQRKFFPLLMISFPRQSTPAWHVGDAGDCSFINISPVSSHRVYSHTSATNAKIRLIISSWVINPG